MSETLYCHTCRVHHPREVMYRYSTRAGYRWRCRRTIAAARSSVRERDEFGKQQTAINRENARDHAARQFLSMHERHMWP